MQLKKHSIASCVAASIVAVAVNSSSADAATIAQAKLTPTPQSVTINNVIVTDIVDTTASASNWVYYLHDATGGCAVIASTATVQAQKNGPDGLPNTSDDLRPGSIVTLTGTSVIFNGLFEVGEIPVAQTMTYGGFSSTPVATAVSTADLLDYSATAPALVGNLVKLSSVKFVQTGTFSGNANYTVTDGTNIVDVRIPTSDNGLVGTAIPTSFVDLSGIVTVFDTAAGSTSIGTKDFQVLLTSSAAITVVPEPMSLGLIGGVMFACGRRRRA